jgi:hypothetical protein
MKKEPYILVPNGGRARRCQALLSNGTKQCSRPASEGFETCSVHGAGKRSRVERGERKAPGRPLEAGLYSKQEMRELWDVLAEVQTLQVDLDKTDEELMLMKATIQWLLNQSGRVQANLDAAGELFDGAISSIEKGITTTEELVGVLDKLTSCSRLLNTPMSYADKMSDHAYKVINATKTRVETRAKMAEAEALENLVTLTQAVRRILHDIMDDPTKLEILEERLEREVFVANKLIKPPLDA